MTELPTLTEKLETKKRAARYYHERFMRYCWQKTSEPFLVGRHTQEVCRLIDKAMMDFRNGKSSFIVVKVPFRHGKSDIVSRYLPPHFLGEFPDSEVMMVTYASSLAEGFSRFARGIVWSPEYKELYPETEISRMSSGVQRWGIEGKLGGCVASGLSSGLTGKGYHLGILDDYCASRAEAESETQRAGMWEHFTNDFLTRRAPVSITIIVATPWHVDDIIGRIERCIDPESPDYDADFPPFNVVTFPAMNGDVKINGEHVKYDYLFPERFSADWYAQQQASLGEYGTASLLQCSPQVRGGNLVDVSKIKVHESIDEFPKTRYTRVWDLAHTARQKLKSDPDWTSGTLLAFTKKDGLWELWIKDVQRFREDTPERDRLIRAVTDRDGGGVTVAVENSLDSKDSVSVLKRALLGKRTVKALNIREDKVARMSYLEPIFEAGNVHILRGDWNLEWLKEVKEFPSGKHDDQVDNLSAGFMVYNAPKDVVIGKLGA